jgi:site-specific DNA-methyltransferase (adenine-specific)
MKSIHVLRKPCSESTVAANVLKHGTGGINVNGSRIAWANEADAAVTTAAAAGYHKSERQGKVIQSPSLGHYNLGESYAPPASGRWPANLVLGACLDEVLGEVFPQTKAAAVYKHPPQTGRNKRTFRIVRKEVLTTPGAGDEGSAARYFKRVS